MANTFLKRLLRPLKTPSGVSSMVTVSAGSFFSFEDERTTAERVESLEAVAVEEVEMVLLLLW